MPAQSTFTNRLAREKSPYLLQHQHNPVDWYAWGEEAFSRAREENKPIFLSIGYSTCHWCHVMERESFENDEIADFLNEHFVSIKVDREERPDVDRIYMTVVQALTGQGGWPLNCFLTPDLKPFFGGTYFPPQTIQNRVGLLDLLQQVHQLWVGREGDILHSARDIHERLQTYIAQSASHLLLSPTLLTHAAELFKQEYDPRYGGFGKAPKFPRPSQPAFLLRMAVRSGDVEAQKMVLHTCDAMAAGGICDQLGGGFHRYSVDAQWLVPHFEKMLYDNAQLLGLYLDAFLVSHEPRFAQVARDIATYVLRDMTGPEGGFYSAEDADSEGKEGKFYCWTLEEVSELLSPEELAVAARYYGITSDGNFVDHSDPEPLRNQNVLSIVDPELSSVERAHLASAQKKMFEARSRRVRPHKDDKILVSWNGLMLGSLARAYAVLREQTYLEAAEKNLQFLRNNLWDQNTKTLYHRWREGERDTAQLQSSYANLLAGVIDLYEVTLKPDYLEFAIDLAEAMLARFYDPEGGGFYQSEPQSGDLILRIKEDHDGAEPSGNSVAVLALLKLAAMTDRRTFKEAAKHTLRLFAARLHDLPQAVPHMLLGLDFFLQEPRRAVIVLKDDLGSALQLLHAIHSVYQPNKVVLGTTGPVEEFVKKLPNDKTPLVFVCSANACQTPTDNPTQIAALLED